MKKKLKKRKKLERFAHLHTHTEYSFLDAIVRVKGLGEILKKKGVKAYAITDHGNMNGVYRFVKDLKAAGVKPIVGCEFYYVPDRHARGLTAEQTAGAKEGLTAVEGRQAVKELGRALGIRSRSHVVVLAKNNAGFQKMIRAQELAFSEGFYYFPRIDKELLLSMAPDVIVMTACIGGIPANLIREEKEEEAFEWMEEMVDHFGDDFYVEIQPNEMEEQVSFNLKLVEMAEELDASIVSTCDVHYLERKSWETHDVLLALREGQRGKRVLVSDPDRFRYTTRELYLKTRTEVERSFAKFHPDIPEEVIESSLDVTLEIAAKCDDDVLTYFKAVLPVVEVEDEYKNSPDKKLWALVKDGWKRRDIKTKCRRKFGEVDWIDGEKPRLVPLYTVYKERVKHEMEEITRMGFSKYFLVIYDLLQWCRDEGIRPGPGRGSVAGSLVAYLMGITAVDSVKYHCPFSRFISPDRIDYPDIDMDFPTVDRVRVKQYVVDKYGEDMVASICNYSTMKSKMVLKDVSRVFGVPYPETEAVVGHIDPKGTLEESFNTLRECKKFEANHPDVVRHAKALEGNARQLGMNAAGMVVADRPIREMIPIQYKRLRDNKGDSVGECLTSWDKVDVEEMGLLKLDVLGIEGLTYIQRTIDLVKERHEIDIEPEDWGELDDPEVYNQFQLGNTELIWQMNTQGTIRILKKLMPDRFEHLIAVTSIIRPGPLFAGVTDSYIKRRHGAKVKSIHPMLDEILESSYGIPVFQESVTKIFHDMAGFSWVEADGVRKAISKKKEEKFAEYKERFVEGVAEKGIDESAANRIWDSISGFGQYAFNRAHACAYSHLSYWTMWFKINYPLEYMTAALESEDIDDKKRRYVREAKRLGLSILAPDANVSGTSFTIDNRVPNTIRIGFLDIKGVGVKTVDKITEAAPYEDFFDFVLRTKGVNKGVVSAMLKVGCFDSICDTPKLMEQNLDEILKVRKRKKGRTEYLEELDLEGDDVYTRQERERFSLEMLAMPPAIHPSVHVFEWVRKNCWFDPNKISDYDEVMDAKWGTLHNCFTGAVTRVQFANTKTDEPERYVKLNLEDDTDFLQATSTPRQYLSMDENSIKKGMVYIAIGRSIGDFRIATGLLVNATDMVEKVKAGHKYEWGTPEHFLLNDVFADYRSALKSHDKLKPLGTSEGRRRCAVYVLDATERETKYGTMLICSVVDWKGTFVDLALYADDYKRFGKRFKPGALLALWVKVKRQGDTSRYTANLQSPRGGKRIAKLSAVCG